ncbi:MAG: bacteriophage holin [Planctomycetota bacterium]
MRLSVKALALAGGVLWAACVLAVGVAHRFAPDYGTDFLKMVASIYPGYEVAGLKSVAVGTVYAFVDGFVGGAVLAWLYNLLAPKSPAA